MKILHVLQSPRAEGTVRLALDWLAETDVDQEVFVLNPQPAELTAELRRAALWYSEGRNWPRGWGKFWWMVRESHEVCLRRRPDLVLCWTNGFSPWILAGARWAGIRRLLTHAGNPPTWDWAGKASTILSTGVAWLTGGKMVCCSRYVAGEFARSPGAFRSVLRWVHNCAPVPLFRAVARKVRAERLDERPRLVMVATLEGHKDHDTLLRAMPALIAAVPGVHLSLAGNGSLRPRLEALARALGIDGRVDFLGSCADVPTLLGGCDLFVFSTTRAEGLGTVLIEALAAGLPVVASDVPACRELLEEGRWGVLVNPGDPAALAQAVIRRLGEPAGEESPGLGAYLESFSPGHMMAAYLEI